MARAKAQEEAYPTWGHSFPFFFQININPNTLFIYLLVGIHGNDQHNAYKQQKWHFPQHTAKIMVKASIFKELSFNKYPINVLTLSSLPSSKGRPNII